MQNEDYFNTVSNHPIGLSIMNGYNAEIDKSRIVEEKDPNKVKLDKEGYFVIVPKADSNTISVEHYSNTNQLLRIIKEVTARNIYWSIIENGWVTEMSHAA